MTTEPITPNMRVAQVLARHPEVLPVLHRYGIQCQDCHAARYESIAQGARVHSIDLHRLLADLNRAAGRRLHPTRTTPTRNHLPLHH